MDEYPEYDFYNSGVEGDGKRRRGGGRGRRTNRNRKPVFLNWWVATTMRVVEPF